MQIATYNIQYSLGTDGVYDLERSLAAVANADIICLQEVEKYWRRSGMTNQPALITEIMPDRYCAYAAQFDVDASYKNGAGRVVNRRRQFGQMTLSRWPILACRPHIFPKRDSGARLNLITGALETVIDAPGGPLRLFNLHLSDAAAEERLQQIRHLMALLRRTPEEGSIWNGTESDPEHWQTEIPPPMPAEVLLLGDFNSEPNSPEYTEILRGTASFQAASPQRRNGHYTFVDAWAAAGDKGVDGTTYRSNPAQGTQWDQRLDYCFAAEPLASRVKRVWVDQATIASDHQPVWVELGERDPARS